MKFDACFLAGALCLLGACTGSSAAGPLPVVALTDLSTQVAVEHLNQVLEDLEQAITPEAARVELRAELDELCSRRSRLDERAFEELVRDLMPISAEIVDARLCAQATKVLSLQDALRAREFEIVGGFSSLDVGAIEEEKKAEWAGESGSFNLHILPTGEKDTSLVVTLAESDYPEYHLAMEAEFRLMRERRILIKERLRGL